MNPIDEKEVMEETAEVETEGVVNDETGDGTTVESKEMEVAPEPDTPLLPPIAKFEKISFEAFCAIYKPIWIDNMKNIMMQSGQNPEDDGFAYKEEEFLESANSIYDNIKIPRRSTAGSAGYDFVFPYGTTELGPGNSMLVPTGIKCNMAPGWVLLEFPRSSLGFKYRIQLDNTVGIIDSDYYNNPSNEGHIMIKVTNDSREGYTCVFNTGDKFCQGIFVPFGITIDDEANNLRTGGLGSTGK